MFIRFCFSFFILLFSTAAISVEQCSAVFPDGIQNNSNSGAINFGAMAQVLNSPDSILASNNAIVGGYGLLTCDTSNCTHSGNIAPDVDYNDFPINSNNISLQYQETLTLEPGNYNNIELGTEAVLILTPGDYKIEGTFTSAYKNQITISGNGVVRFFVKQAVTLSNESEVNLSGDASNFLLYSALDIKVDYRAKVNGFIYSKQDVLLFNEAVVTGAVSGKNVQLNDSAKVNFVDTPPDFDDWCAGNAIKAIAEYRFDETEYTDSPGEIIDSINGFNGRAKSSQPIAGGKVCNAIDLSASGVADYAILDKSIVNGKTDFTVSLWSKTSKTSGQSLFSAAGGAHDNEMLMWYSNDVNFEAHLKQAKNGLTSTTSIADNNWHHLVWTRQGSQSCIYHDKVLQGCTTQATGALSIQSLILGQEQDNVGGGFDASQAFEGLIDELLIFDSAISVDEIADIYDNQNAGLGYDGSARSCPVSLVFNMRFDESAWSGASAEVIDETGNFNAQSQNGASTAQIAPAIEGNPGTCGYGTFDGDNDYVALPSSFENQQGSFTITAWINPSNLDPGSRIFADDENNTHGYAFSLSDPGSGKLRFYSRGISPSAIDTQSSVISANTWTFVAVVHDSVAKTRQIYVNGVAQTLAIGGTSGVYTGTWGVDNGIASIGGETDSGETGYRFTGAIDEVRMYDGALTSADIVAIKNETHPCETYIDHFEIHHDGQGLTCAAENITIKACADADCSTLYSDAIDVQLSINDSPDKTITVIDGSTDTSFVYTDTDTPATLSLDQSYECKNGDSTSCDVAFAEAGFLLTLDNHQSCTSADLTIKAVRLSDSGLECAPAYTGEQSVNFVFKYANPTSGTKVPKLDEIAMAAASAEQNRTINFDATGTATLSFNYKDAGQVSIDVSDAASAGLAADSVTAVVSPAKLIVSSPDANASCASGDATCSVFKSAGTTFNLAISAACSDDTITENFEMNNIPLTVDTIAPNVGHPVSLSITSIDIVDADNGAHTENSQTVSEVGVFTITATPPVNGYFGETVPAATSGNIGRFIPDHFDVSITSHSFLDACASGTTDFTYIGQPFGYLNEPELLITAKNASGITTQNYTEDGYQKLVAGDIARTFSDKDHDQNGADNATKMAISAVTNVGVLTTPTSDPRSNAGVMTYTFSDSDSFTYTKDANSLVEPFTMDYDIVIDSIEDAEGVNASAALAVENTVSPTGVNLRFGRAYLANSFGPETSALPQTLSVQYFKDDEFVLAADDVCSVYNSSNISFGTNEVGIDIADIPAVEGSFDDILDEPDGITRAIVLPKAGTGNRGKVEVIYTIDDWLKFDWAYDDEGVDGLYNDNPRAIATFGLFRGNDRIIYQREVHN